MSLRTMQAYVSPRTPGWIRADTSAILLQVMVPPQGSLSKQEYELQIATNCMGPYLLTKLLKPLLEKTAKLSNTTPGSVRVTWAGSLGVDVASPKGGVVLDQAGTYVPNPKDIRTNYGATKAGNLYLSKEFARRYPYQESGIISNCWNPGNLRTELQRHASWIEDFLIRWMLHPAVFGAYTELWAGWDEEAGKPEKNGAYVVPWGRFSDYREDLEVEIRKEDGNAARFWDWCEKETKQYA